MADHNQNDILFHIVVAYGGVPVGKTRNDLLLEWLALL